MDGNVSTTDDAGAFFNATTFDGLYSNADLTIRNSTLSGNSASNFGGLFSDGGDVTLGNVIVANSVASAVTVLEQEPMRKADWFSASSPRTCTVTI